MAYISKKLKNQTAVSLEVILEASEDGIYCMPFKKNKEVFYSSNIRFKCINEEMYYDYYCDNYTEEIIGKFIVIAEIRPDRREILMYDVEMFLDDYQKTWWLYSEDDEIRKKLGID